MIDLSPSKIDATLKSIGTERPGIYGITSFSSGIRTYTVHQLIRIVRSIGKKIINIDARMSATSPALFYDALQPASSKTVFSSNLDIILSAVSSLTDSVVVIHHAEELLSLSHYPDCKKLFHLLPQKIKPTSSSWIFIWISENFIPPDLINDTDIFHLSQLNMHQLSIFLKQQEISFPLNILKELPQYVESFPEYLPPLISLIKQKSISPKSVHETLLEQLNQPGSYLDSICLSKWLEILMLSKGFSSLKTILGALAHQPRIRLTDIARQVSNSLPATKDYLNILLKSGVIHRLDNLYEIVDPVFAEWIKSKTRVLRNKPIEIAIPKDRNESASNTAEKGRIRPMRRRDDDFIEYD